MKCTVRNDNKCTCWNANKCTARYISFQVVIYNPAHGIFVLVLTQCIITGRISIDTQIARFSTKMEVNPEIWDAKTGRATGKTKEVTKINRTLDNLEQEIQSHYDRLVLEDGYVTVEVIKNALNGVGLKATGLLELFREHNEEFKYLVGVNRVKNTYEHYLHSYRVLENFLGVRFQVKDVALNQLTHSFIDAYDFHLVDKRMNGNTVLNHTIPLRKIVRRALAKILSSATHL